jgi:hypothetical protein
MPLDFRALPDTRAVQPCAVKTMTKTKFVVKVNRGGTRALEYVQRVDSTPIHMTTNRELALLMERFTAEDAVKSLPPVQPRASFRAS